MKGSRQADFPTWAQQAAVRSWFAGGLCFLLCFAWSGSADAQESKVLAAFREPVINPGFERLIEEMPLLATGSAFTFVEKEQWLIVATGQGFLMNEEGVARDEFGALKVAQSKAARRLAETLHGYTTSGIDKSQVISKEQNGVAVIERVVTSLTERKVSEYLKNAETVGHWTNESGDAVVVMVVIGSPSHPLLARQDRLSIKLVEPQWKEQWEEHFLKRPAILTGGASLVEVDGEFYVLAVGRVNLAKVSDDPVKQKRVAENDVLRHASSLLNGISVDSTVRVESVFRELNTDERVLASSVKETLASTTELKVRTTVRVPPEVGQWKSEDARFAYFAHVFPLSVFIGDK